MSSDADRDCESPVPARIRGVGGWVICGGDGPREAT